MANTTKPKSPVDGNQALQKSFNVESSTLGVDGFISGKVGHKVSLAISTTTIADDTETYTFEDSGVTLFVITIIYTDGSRETMLSAERTA